MLDLSQYLTEVRAKQPRLAVALQNIQDAVNQTNTVNGTDPTQMISAPDPPQAINVKAANGVAHVTITDNSQRSRALNYFVEAATNPSFQNAHVEHLGASRGRFITLPGKTDGDATQNWYFRAYSMYPGSEKASAHQVLGGTTPTPVNVGGTTQLTPLSSTGAGTASTTGQEAGNGFGQAQFSELPPNTPKAI